MLAKIRNLILKIKGMKKHPNPYWIRKYMNIYNYFFIKSNNLKYYKPKNPDEFQELVESKKHSNAILDGWLYLCNKLINMFRKEHDCKDFSFIDVGCGNGLPLVFVKKKFDFQSVSGFDFIKEVVERCKGNVDRAGLKDINIFIADAKNFKLDNKKYLLYMFNPFDAEIMNEFMKNNIDIMQKTGSVIAYYNQLSDELNIIEKFQYKKIIKDDYYKISIIKY